MHMHKYICIYMCIYIIYIYIIVLMCPDSRQGALLFSGHASREQHISQEHEEEEEDDERTAAHAALSGSETAVGRTAAHAALSGSETAVGEETDAPESVRRPQLQGKPPQPRHR